MSWQPSCSIANLKQRANLLKQTRQYFDQSGALEVETPIWSSAAVTDPWLDSFKSQNGYLQTSPEFFMKRLLAAGSGDIYQICKCFRIDEVGRKHNPEFTMLEWYRVGMSYQALINEVADFIQNLLGERIEVEQKTYHQWFFEAVGLELQVSNYAEICQKASQHAGFEIDDIETALDILMTHVVEPNMNAGCLSIISHYPEDQAALAQKVTHQGYAVAERFEVFYQGMELANGYHELTDATEQRTRMQADLLKRQELNKEQVCIDEYFLQALEHGMPECSGVALGLDRLIMIALGQSHISEIMSFSHDNA